MNESSMHMKTVKDSVKRDSGYNIREAEKELIRYLELTEKIRDLSVPQLKAESGAENYRQTLLDNYTDIGTLARDSSEILRKYFFPHIKDEGTLTQQEIIMMRSFSRALSNAYQINNMDIPLVYAQAGRLLQDAEDKGDDNMLVAALDEMVSTAYVMMSMTQRLIPVREFCQEYAEVGLDAAERLLAYLEKDRFKALTDEAKEMTLINARYIRVVSEINGIAGEPMQNSLLLSRMKAALDLANDPFYREQAPTYNWDLHEFRTLEYIASLTDHCNEKGYNFEDLVYINQCTKRMKELYDSDNALYRNAHKTGDLDIYLCRNAYLVGEISLEEYKRRLEEISLFDYRKDLSEGVMLVMLHAPLEYLIVLDRDNLSEEEKSYCSRFYRLLVKYMHQTPKKGRLTFLLSYLCMILKIYVPANGPDFESLCLSLIAALHPPTYVHSLAVADFTLCLTRHMLKKRPELFIGMPGCERIEDVRSRERDIKQFAYHSALCHDVGKLAIIETIITYGRDLSDEEIKYIRSHQSIGAYMLSLYPETERYQDVARGHHKWFDNKGGYPDDFDLEASPYKSIISIVTCADCLDAATDAVGRSYKVGKSLDQLLEEFKAESGTRYDPDVVELMLDEEVQSEIRAILEEERDNNYIETFETLRKNEIE